MLAMTTHKPIKLIVHEPTAGSFFWVLVQTAPDDGADKELKSAEDAADSYEAALAAGTRALDAELHPREAQSGSA